MPCFKGVVSMGGACSRFYDTSIQRFAENLYHDRLKNRGQIPIHFAPQSRLSRPPWGRIFWSFAQKMVPKPCGSGVMFRG
jgi:hypothetical protein